jgi:hypothetical protein
MKREISVKLSRLFVLRGLGCVILPHSFAKAESLCRKSLVFREFEFISPRSPSPTNPVDLVCLRK